MSLTGCRRNAFAEAAVPIRLHCPNGHLLETADEHAGKKVRCSICQAIADVPVPAPAIMAPLAPAVTVPLPPPALSRTPPAPPLTNSAEFRPRPLFTPLAPTPTQQTAQPEHLDHLEEIAPEVIEEEEEENLVVAEFLAPPPDERIAPRGEARYEPELPQLPRGYRDDLDRRLPRRPRTPEEEDERRKKKQRRRQRRDFRAMKLVRLGLGFHAVKVLAWLLSILLFMIMIVSLVMIGVSMVAQGAQGARDTGALDAAQGVAVLFGSVITILFLIAPFLGITGSILCCFVTPKTRARPLIFTSLILDGVPLVLGAMAMILGALATQMGVSGLSAMGRALMLLAFCSEVAALVLFMLFVKAIASFYGDRGTGNEAVHVMIHLFVISIGGFGVVFGSSYVLRFVFLFGPILQICMFLGWIWMIVKIVIRLFNVIQTTRGLIG
jgi:hypothetical protein